MSTHGTISKWGNSLAVRLPKHVTDAASLAEGSPVEIAVTDGTVTLKPARKEFKLEDLLAGERKAKKKRASKEFDWGKPAGDEIW